MTGTDHPDVGGIPQLVAPERITGFVALVIQPNSPTILKAYDLAQTLMPAAAEQVTAPGSLPHLTLTQCALRDAPRARIRESLAEWKASGVTTIMVAGDATAIRTVAEVM